MKIYPSFDLPINKNSSYFHFIESLGQLIEEIIPKEILALHYETEAFLEMLAPILPLIGWSRLQDKGNAFEMTVLCQAEYSHGTGRFLSDALSRRLIPGKIVELGGTRTLSFYFSSDKKHEYLINQRIIIENDPDCIEWIKKKAPVFVQEIQLTLLSIFKTRHFLSLRSENLDKRALLTQEIQHLSAFEEMHQIITRLSAEKTTAEIRNYIKPIYQKRPKIFDRDVFDEVKPFITIYNEKFLGNKNPRFVSRLICYHFYFKKLIAEKTFKEPLSRQILLKIFRKEEFCGILLGINLFGENEILKKHHLIEAVKNCLPDLEIIQDSFLIDNSLEYRPIFYVEIKKRTGLPVSPQEIILLRKNLPLELQQCIQSILNPLFMLRNEEDQLRYIISLSRELRSVKDIPHIVISFEDQTKDELSFSVVLLRILKKGCDPIKELLVRFPYKTHLRELKNIGWIRNKYPKEVSIFKVSLSKRAFIRKDHSLDLPRARKIILLEIENLFQRVRDFNGGLLSKQLENLEDLKDLLKPIAQKNAFLLENYFFSLEPLIAQTTLRPSFLKEGFLILLGLIREQRPHIIESFPEGMLAGFAIVSSVAKESITFFLETTRNSFKETSYSLVHIHDLYYLIVLFPDKESTNQREFNELLAHFVESKHFASACSR